MQYALKWFLCIGLSTIASISAHAQSIGPAALDVAGGSKKISGITHEYAIGQVLAGDSYSNGGSYYASCCPCSVSRLLCAGK